MKILIVDDNKKRSKEIEELILNSLPVLGEDIHKVYSSQDAKQILRVIQFDFLILDVVLPRRNETPTPQIGLGLLKDIKKRPTIKKPGKIVGITAHVDDIDDFRQEFDLHCEVIIEASHRNSDWKSKITNCIQFEETKKISTYTDSKNIICLTVHGIRTRGEWQQDLKSKVQTKVDSVKFESYKYGYFAIVSFMIPFLRRIQVLKFKNSLRNILERESNNENFIIFCHSFGTYIVVKAIEELISDGLKLNIDKLVLSGSVLRSSHDFSIILNNTSAQVINDCGCNDLVLLLSEGFVPNTGMAGKVGFYGLNNDRFVNRYFKGGHSHYFNKESKFIDKYWIPLFSTHHDLNIIDQRDDSIINLELIDKIFSMLGKIKEFIYFFIFISIFLFVLQHLNLTTLTI